MLISKHYKKKQIPNDVVKNLSKFQIQSRFKWDRKIFWIIRMTMTQEIKLTTDQMKLMSLFQNITKATARDCIEDEKRDRIIFVVNEGKMGLAIGKGGAHIKSLQNKIDRNVELVEYNEDPIRLLKNILNEKYITDIKISERLDGSFQANVEVDGAKKGVVVGREGRNAEKARILARRYFNITYVMINSKEQAFEW